MITIARGNEIINPVVGISLHGVFSVCNVPSCEILGDLLQQLDSQPQSADGKAVNPEPPEFSCDAHACKELERKIADHCGEYQRHEHAKALSIAT